MSPIREPAHLIIRQVIIKRCPESRFKGPLATLLGSSSASLSPLMHLTLAHALPSIPRTLSRSMQLSSRWRREDLAIIEKIIFPRPLTFCSLALMVGYSCTGLLIACCVSLFLLSHSRSFSLLVQILHLYPAPISPFALIFRCTQTCSIYISLQHLPSPDETSYSFLLSSVVAKQSKQKFYSPLSVQYCLASSRHPLHPHPSRQCRPPLPPHSHR